jgi:hypothetical protein
VSTHDDPPPRRGHGWWLTAAAVSSATIVAAQAPAPSPSAEARAVAYLATEVPRWRREHPCYSCHNNGDAARALLIASRRGHDVGSSLDDTVAWLSRPDGWDRQVTTGGFDDKALAHVQFASALGVAADSGRAGGAALEAAARVVARDQTADGSWKLDVSQSVGSPVTYGTVLATATAAGVLRAANLPEHRRAVERAESWLAAAAIHNVLDSSAVVLGLRGSTDGASTSQKARALTIIDRAQAPDGGWGLYETSRPEPFDTALAVLALLSAEPTDHRRDQIARGRQYLIATQLADGSWPETTRPGGQESYAQRISTTGWAALALLGSSVP